MENKNYNVNNSTENANNIENNKIVNIDISSYTFNNIGSNSFEIDVSKYKNNKPIRKIIRGSIINGGNCNKSC